MGRYIKFYKIFESNDQHDYVVGDEKYGNDIDFVVRVIPSKKTISFYRDNLFEHCFYVIDMNVPGYDTKPLTQNIVPQGGFILAAVRLMKAMESGVFPGDLSHCA